MTARKKHILVVDDEASIVFAFRRFFEKRGFEVTAAPNLRDARACLAGPPPDVVFFDVCLPDGNGLDAVAQLRTRHPELPVIVMTAYGSLETVARALSLNILDYLVKPVDLDQAEVLVNQALAAQAARDGGESDRAGTPEPPAPTAIVGRSPVMQQLFKRIGLVAATEAAVLLTGETGTGKELAARAIHDLSHRRAGPFVAVNCGALPEHLVESEIFGHVRGAFTGAEADKPGRFELAGGGTLLLDEIGELTPAVQVKLLRFLDTRTIERVGAVTPLRLDVRVLAATNRDLPAEVAAGRFRADLYYRLAVVHLVLPPLREREGDIALLAPHFLRLFTPASETGLAPETVATLLQHRWPGNVRELRNAVEHAAVVAGGKTLLPTHLPDSVRFPAPGTRAAAPPPAELLRRYVELVAAAGHPALYAAAVEPLEQALIDYALQHTGGNQSAAAELLGLHRNTLRQKLKEHAHPPT